MKIPRLHGILVAMTVGASVLPAQIARSLTGGGRPGVDVLHYAFRVEFPAIGQPDTLRFVVTATARRLAPVRTITLDLVASMRVDSVHVNARPADFTRPGDSVRVSLPAGDADTLRLAVFYHGIPTDGLIIRRDSNGDWSAFGDNFPDRARQWLAVVDHPSDKALVDWDVLAPATHRVIANGALVEESPEAGVGGLRRVRTRWRTVRPIYTAVMVIGVAPFAVVELGDTACGAGELPGCVRQSVWTSASQRANMPGNFARAGEIVALFSRLAGPFPYEKLAHVASSTRYGGMENAGAIFYAAPLFQTGSPSESLIAHETAHQWFGDAVTELEWPHVWLSEGFATYFAALWTEHAHGERTFRDDLTAMRTKVLQAPITFTTPVINDTLDDVTQVLNSNVYEKAGFVLHMLRLEIGDSAFFGGIQLYYAQHRHATALTDDLQSAFERTAGRPLGWFFTQWLRRPGAADVRTSWRWDAGQRQIVLTVVQGTRVPPYQLGLSVDVTDATGQTVRTRVTVPAQLTSQLVIPLTLNDRPRDLLVDADVSVLGRIVAR